MNNETPGNPTINHADVEKIKAQLKRWQEKLLDISKSNPLLGLNRGRSAKLKILNPDYLELFQKLAIDEVELKLPYVKKIPKKDSGLFEDPTPDEKYTYEVEQGDIDFDSETSSDLKRKIKKIYDNAHVTLEERGVITLFLTIKAIRWNDALLGESISPLLLVPCEFIYKGPNTALKLKIADEDVSINPALKYYLKEKHKIVIPELNTESQTLFSTGGLDQYFNDVSNKIVELGASLIDESWLGTFNFESLVLYQDLSLMADIACKNPLIATLAHALNIELMGSEALPEELDNLKAPNNVPVAILPADASQLKAVTYASQKSNLVVHGPPGTGKSQTISNIIADARGKNKKVLFVSSKMAALNVVFDRLKREDLGQFCLEAHGIKAGKMKIIEDLKRTIESSDSYTVGPLREELENLQKIKDQLNGYALALHKVRQPLNKSLFQAIGQLAKLTAVRDLKAELPWKDINSVSQEDVSCRLEALSELSQSGKLLSIKNTHPLRGLTCTSFNLQFQETLEKNFLNLKQKLDDVTAILQNLSPLLPLEILSFNDLLNIQDLLDTLSKIESLPSTWSKSSIQELESEGIFFKDAAQKAQDHIKVTDLYHHFSDLPLKETLEILSEQEIRFNSFFKRLSPSYFKWKNTLKTKLKPDVRTDYMGINKCISYIKQLEILNDWFSQNESHILTETTKEGLVDPVTLSEKANQFLVATQLRTYLDNQNYNYSSDSMNKDTFNASAAIVTFLNEFEVSIKGDFSQIDALFPEGFTKPKCVCLQAPLHELLARTNEVLNNLNGLREWVLMDKKVRHCGELGVDKFIENLNERDAASLPAIFEKRFLTLWIDENINNDQYLVEFSALKHTELVEKLGLLDKKTRKLANMYIKASASSISRDIKSARNDLTNGSEVGILRFEMQKRKRVKSLRKLFGEIPHVLQALKPCMLMSPVSVSTYLKPGSFHFDIVIFDEASQLPTPEAIPAILRADQVVVAGDPNQLPPTSFFSSTLFEDETEDFEDDPYISSLESLLDDCVASVPFFTETHLKWHYRSRDEKLINFSNHYFYENSLITFPNPDIKRDGQGVRLEYVPDGIWDRGKSRTNRQEARRVAQLAIEHFSKHPERSLGIVALNISQKEAIDDAISEELVSHPDLLPFFDTSKEDAYFVKSLENVQGDERDVMIISIGYGKDKDGGLTLNFGPLNSEGGWRRLNVLVTRSRWQVILVTSLRSFELQRVNLQNRGASSLKYFIEYCEREGVLPPDPAKVIDVETNDFEDAVRQELVEKGLSVDAQVGVGSFRIDLAVRDPRDSSKYLIGIECDGATYHSSKVARDRDLMREEILKNMGWKLHRVWSTEWFKDRETALLLMLSSIERALSGKLSESLPADATISDENYIYKTNPIPSKEKKYKAGVPYGKYSKKYAKDYVLKNIKKYSLADILSDMIATEGPIHKDLLEERVKETFEVTKIGNNIRKNLTEAINSAIREKKVAKKGDFLVSMISNLSTFRVPSANYKRTLRLTSKDEVALAVLYLIEDQFGIMKDYIPHAVATLFEDPRMEADEVDWVKDTTEELIRSKILVESGNKIYLSS